MHGWLGDNNFESEGTMEGFADDLTVIFEFSRESLGVIKSILDDFYLISGLKLHIKKTQLMIAGSDAPRVGETVLDIVVVDSVKILGLKIDRKLERLSENWDDKINKMVRLANFWSLQKLSINAKIALFVFNVSPTIIT